MAEHGGEPGDVLRGKYRIKRVLGEGGMGVVVRATHVKLDQDVAIKMLRGDSARSERVVARFAREARAAARLRGDHVVRIVDVDEGEGGAPFIVMEYLEGTDLERLVRKEGPLAIDRAVRYALEACEGLAEAHAASIVHRDVKPANLFLARTPRGPEIVKLLDFGISKATEANDPTITEADRLLGSPSFMSPEQLKAARDVDARTDIWSLGVVLYFLLTRRLPFEGDSATAVAAKIASEEPPPLSELCPEIPAELERVVARCLAKDRGARFASVAELAHALAPFSPEGRAAAGRVSSVLRVPVAGAAASASGTGPAASSARVPAAERLTASLSELAGEGADEAVRPSSRPTASLDAPGPVSIGDGTQDREIAPPPAKAKQRSRSWLLVAALAGVVAVIGWIAIRGSGPPGADGAARTSSDEPRPAVDLAATGEAEAAPGASAAPETPATPRASAGPADAGSPVTAPPTARPPTIAPTAQPASSSKPPHPPASASSSEDPFKLDLK